MQHLTDCERYWFGHVVAGDPRWSGVDGSMVVPDHRTGADRVAAPPDEDRRWSVRWVVAHMTSEVVRHAGHADILREQADEVTGR